MTKPDGMGIGGRYGEDEMIVGKSLRVTFGA
jgi:hypothetical protein